MLVSNCNTTITLLSLPDKEFHIPLSTILISQIWPTFLQGQKLLLAAHKGKGHFKVKCLTGVSCADYIIIHYMTFISVGLFQHPLECSFAAL